MSRIRGRGCERNITDSRDTPLIGRNALLGSGLPVNACARNIFLRGCTTPLSWDPRVPLIQGWPAEPETDSVGVVDTGSEDERDEFASGGEEEDGGARSQARLRKMLADLVGSGQSFRRGSQDLVTGVAMATKEEALRIITSEVRGFLDKMDVADLMQQIVEGLVVDVHTKIRFERASDGEVRPTVGETKTEISTKQRGRSDGGSSGAPQGPDGDDP